MQKIQNISIFLSFVGLWLTSLFSAESEIILGYLLIFSFGILHGANDMLILNQIPQKKAPFSIYKQLAVYIATVLIAVLVFYFIPLLALVLFIISSAYHFGQQHWEHRNLVIPIRLKMANYTIYGLLVLMLLFVFNREEVITIVFDITNYGVTATLINAITFITLIAFILFWGYLIWKHKVAYKDFGVEVLYLLVFCIIFKVSTVIWGFTIYFIFWHSIPSLYEQIIFVYREMNTRNLLKYCLNALPYWLISIAGIILLYFFLENQKIFAAVLFSFIAAVTFPHAIVIDRLFSNKKSTIQK